MIAGRRLRIALLVPLAFGLLLVFLLGLTLVVNNRLGNTVIEQNAAVNGRTLTTLASELFATPLATLDIETLNNLLEEFVSGESNIVYVAVRNASGRIIGSEATAAWSVEQNTIEFAQQAVEQNTLLEQELDPFLFFVAPVVVQEQPIGSLEMALDLTPARSTFQSAQQFLFITAGIILALTLIILISFSQAGANQLNYLVESADRIRDGDLEQKIIPRGPLELYLLGQALENMRSELQAVYSTLEKRVSVRTRELQISMDISNRLSTILDKQLLINEVVQILQGTFDFYHTQIYLFDTTDEILYLAGGSGQVGRQLREQRHQLTLGQGLVGQAASTQQPILLADVTESQAWLPNPLLPETKSEVAVPIILNEQLLGVLDVQHNVLDGLTTNTTALLESIANQVAIALRNADFYEQARQQAAYEAQVNSINQKIRNTTTVDEVLRLAAQELGQVMQAKQARVQIGGQFDERQP